MTTPKNSLLTIAIDKFLTNHPDVNWDVYHSFPSERKTLAEGKGLVILEYLGDEYEGKVISSEIRYPTYLFTLYQPSYVLAVKAVEDLIEIFDKYLPSQLVMDNQVCHQVEILAKDFGRYDDKWGLYYSQVLYGFNLIGNFVSPFEEPTPTATPSPS